MKPVKDILFLDQKILVLQATDDFAFHLEKARNHFDLTHATKVNGIKAVGITHFYELSGNLIKWVFIHNAFRQAYSQHQKSGYRKRAASDLSLALTELQFKSSGLLVEIERYVRRSGRQQLSKGLAVTTTLEHVLGIDILKTIKCFKPEQYWANMFDQGFQHHSISAARYSKS